VGANETAGLLLLDGVLPLWVAAGLADWACHWRTGIEHTAGLAESAFHWLMFSLVGTGVVAGLLLRLNAGLLMVCAALAVVHHVVVYIELRHVAPLREIRPFEQMVHSFLELLPFTALALLAVLAAAAGELAWPLNFGLALREPALPGRLVAGMLLAVLLFNAVPLLHEFWRAWVARRRRLAQQQARP
jgi:hypothetical protein